VKFLTRVWRGLFEVFLDLLPSEKIQGLRRLSVVGLHKLDWILSNSPSRSVFTDEQKHTIIHNFRSQLGQDVMAMSVAGASKKGFFVEFGATDGLSLSNTYLLERYFGWSGILSEPARKWHSALKRNRRSSTLDFRCVYSESHLTLDFQEARQGQLSTIKGFGESDTHANSRDSSVVYSVSTVSLLDLLREHGAPKFIDFLSVDTEGSEYEILKSFDFSEYRFGLVCVEHNYTSNRKLVCDLLESKGYVRVHQTLSDFDDWYVQDPNL
jgi:FkbM family methyltransferase